VSRYATLQRTLQSACDLHWWKGAREVRCATVHLTLTVLIQFQTRLMTLGDGTRLHRTAPGRRLMNIRALAGSGGHNGVAMRTIHVNSTAQVPGARALDRRTHGCESYPQARL